MKEENQVAGLVLKTAKDVVKMVALFVPKVSTQAKMENVNPVMVPVNLVLAN